MSALVCVENMNTRSTHAAKVGVERTVCGLPIDVRWREVGALPARLDCTLCTKYIDTAVFVQT